ncbi:MAG: sugar ABC transporter ATP-binding protein [Euzebyaceae bacterium]|nr:sugar ABC transporter ATP-binding protein [Euzebyaceae bacterium]
MTEPLAELRSVSKGFPGVLALDHVDLALYPGEIHGLAGENGAGKSTLVKVLSGAHTPDVGELRLHGRPVRFRSPREALAAGIGVVHQELAGAPHLTVTENVLLGRLPSGWGRVRWAEAHRQARAVLDRLEIPIDERVLMGRLSLGRQQLVEIARALVRESQVLILDEPSAILGQHDLEVLFTALRGLRDRGVACLYISHRLNELFELTDRVTVLKDGAHVATEPIGDLSMDQLVALMTGRELVAPSRPVREASAAPLLEVDGLTRAGAFADVSFRVHPGEIVGMAGLVGSGRTEVARAIAGVDHAEGGTIGVRGRTVRMTSPRAALRYGIGLLPEDRKDQGLLMNRSVRENIGLASLRKRSRFGILRGGRDSRDAAALARQVDLRYRGLDQLVRFLSGGNQQKVMLARCLGAESQILILDEPTRGVDVGGKSEIYALMRQLVDGGVGILMISSEIEEIVMMSDRVLVMRAGRLVLELAGDDIEEDQIMRAALVHSVADRQGAVA